MAGRRRAPRRARASRRARRRAGGGAGRATWRGSRRTLAGKATGAEACPDVGHRARLRALPPPDGGTFARRRHGTGPHRQAARDRGHDGIPVGAPRVGERVVVNAWVRTRRDSKGGFSFLELNFDGSCLLEPPGHLRGRAPQLQGGGDPPPPAGRSASASEGLSSPRSPRQGPGHRAPGRERPRPRPLRRHLPAAEEGSHASSSLPHHRPPPPPHRTAWAPSSGCGAPWRRPSMSTSGRRASVHPRAHRHHRQRRGGRGADVPGDHARRRQAPPRRRAAPSTYFPKDFFFGQKTHLTVSGQLEAEDLSRPGRSATCTPPSAPPSARENSKHRPPPRAEFWMIEPEMAFYRPRRQRQGRRELPQVGREDRPRPLRRRHRLPRPARAARPLCANLQQVVATPPSSG